MLCIPLNLLKYVRHKATLMAALV